MNVRDLMKQDLAVCCPDDTLGDAARLMWQHDCGFVPLVEPETGHLLGTITDRDICMAALSSERPIHELSIATTMHRGAHACSPDDDLSVVHGLMREHQVRRLPVVDDAGSLIGVISLNDLGLQALDQEQPERAATVAETLGTICQHREMAAV